MNGSAPRDTGMYELRPVSYLSFRAMPVCLHGWFSTDPGYWCETDTEKMDSAERANADGDNPEWWKAPWVRDALRAGLGPEELSDEQ